MVDIIISSMAHLHVHGSEFHKERFACFVMPQDNLRVAAFVKAAWTTLAIVLSL